MSSDAARPRCSPGNSSLLGLGSSAHRGQRWAALGMLTPRPVSTAQPRTSLTEEDRWDGQVKGHHAIAISWTKRGRPQRPGEAKVQDRLMGHTALLLRGIPPWSQCG